MWNFTSNAGLAGHAAQGFTFPFRAVAVEGAPNVLTAGKTISMTYAANTAAREHLDEWSCGVGVGAAAALMAVRGWNSTEMLRSIKTLQSVLRSAEIGQPLSWAGTSPTPSPIGPSYVCGAQRCFQSDGSSSAAARGIYANNSCINTTTGNSDCSELQPSEWLLLRAHWHVAQNHTQAIAVFDTRIKKSELPASSLPSNEEVSVAKGSKLVFSSSAAVVDASYILAAVTQMPTPQPPTPPPPLPPQENFLVTSHSPEFRWRPVVNRSEAFSIVLTVTEAKTGTTLWASPPTWTLPSTGIFQTMLLCCLEHYLPKAQFRATTDNPLTQVWLG